MPNVDSLEAAMEKLKSSSDNKERDAALKEIIDAAKKLKKENLRVNISDKSALSKSRIASKKTSTRSFFARVSKEQLNVIKGIIKKSILNVKKAVYSSEIKGLKVANVTVQILNIPFKVVHKVVGTGVKGIIKITKNQCKLLKEQLSIEKNTLRFKNAMATLRMHGLELQNKVIGKTIEVATKTKEKVDSSMYNLKSKSLLVKEKIGRKIEHKKTVIVRKTGMEIALAKATIKSMVSSVKGKVSSVGYNLKNKSLLAKEKIGRKIEHKKTVIVRKTGMEIALAKAMIKSMISSVKGKVSSVGYNLKSKSLLAKEKIGRKIEHKKTVMTRKTGMEIALTKAMIKSKIDSLQTTINDLLSVDDEKLKETRNKIEALREERNRLVGELFQSEELSTSKAM